MIQPNHGGDRAGFLSVYGREPLDFSANISPLGMPEGVRRASAESLSAAHCYPDPHCRALRGALSAHLRIPAEHILCGNGAADLIERLVQALRPRNALLTAPTFGEYGQSLRRANCHVTEYFLQEKDDFTLTGGILSSITPDTDVLFLCEPNNPTGLTAPRELLLQILARCRETGCLLVLDECFNDFLEYPAAHSLIDQLDGGGIIILRAFTKFYGMAGLRLGYCMCADKALLADMAAAGQPWPVSTVAQAAGIAALKETEYAHLLRETITRQRESLIGSLRGLGFHVVPGKANYLFFRHTDTTLKEKLEEKGVMIRSCEDYSGLDHHWYRIAVRTEEENTLLLRLLREVTY